MKNVRNKEKNECCRLLKTTVCNFNSFKFNFLNYSDEKRLAMVGLGHAYDIMVQ